MKTREFKYPAFRKLRSAIGVLILGIALISWGCDSTNADRQELEVVGIEVIPEDHNIIEGENKKFTGLAVTSTGDKIPFEELDNDVWKWEWAAVNTQIATFDNTGLATGHEVGSTMCWISLNNTNSVSGISNFVNNENLLKSAADSTPPSLRRTFDGLDSFGVQVVSPAKLKEKFNLH